MVDVGRKHLLMEQFLHFEYFPMNHVQIGSVRKIDVIIAVEF